ncbi:MAG: ABC transporter ATP-binding protein [Lachnospiraceae bacterium]|nr:ABC transporter ATP-binding protein [Lachnospiraceae bacterium]
MKRYFIYIKRVWYYFLFGPMLMVLEACGEFILPYISANMINVGTAGRDIPYILKNGLLMAVISLAMLIFGVAGANFGTRGAAELAADIRLITFKKIQQFSFANIDSFSTGSLITRITNDVSQVQNFTQMFLRGLFRSPVMIIGAIVMSFKLEQGIGWIVFMILPFLAFIIAAIMVASAPRYTVMQQQIDGLNTRVKETVTNQKVIKSFVREEDEIEYFSRINGQLFEKSVRALKLMLLMQPLSTLIVNGATLAVVWFAGQRIMIGNMEIGTLTALITYLTQVLTALNFLANIILLGTRAAASNKRILEVLDAPVDLHDNGAGQKEAEILQGSIRFEGVSFGYYKQKKEKILKDIHLEIEAGQLVGIIGSSGSGKSTLVSLIPRLYDVDEGRICVDGIDVRQLSLKRLRESVAMVLQKNTLFSGTIEENLRWGNEEAGYQELVEACKLARADEFIKGFKKGYETRLEQGGANLSGGQQQRLCIARALLKKPRIIILDDSTSAVDTATDASIRRAFRERLVGVTKLIIAQRINSVIDADKIIVMDEGRIVGTGKHEELMASCEEYREIYFSQRDSEEERPGA